MRAGSMRGWLCLVMLGWTVVAYGQAARPETTRFQPSRPADAEDDRDWYDARDLPIEGRPWTDTEAFYERLPARAEALVTPAVWRLSKNTAGMAVRFVTDADQISVRWTLTSASLAMPHMAATGMSGVDLYVRHEGKWRWIAVGRPTAQSSELARAATRVPKGPHEYLLYLPLYNGVRSLSIGVPRGSLMQAPPPDTRRPICVYGTSIVQGGCATRPGMAHVAILGRRLDWPTINLGFSGSAKMEPAIATLLAELDVAVYVLDSLPNMTAEMVDERFEPFVTALRKARPETPIVLVENITPQATVFLPAEERPTEAKNVAMRRALQRLQAAGITGLYHVPGETLLGDDGEATVDGTHPTDVGFIRMADALEPVLRKILGR